MKEYDQWAAAQAERLAGELRRAAMAGDFSRKAYFMPAGRNGWADIVLSHEMPAGATHALEFLSYGQRTENVSAVPYAALGTCIRDACRELPVYPLPS